MQTEFDIVIIGSGLGGLVCGAVLGMEGYRVCILEKNRQLGGCLQTFARDKVLFDSGVHYIGGLDKGQNLYQVFKYLGLMDKLNLERMDEAGFDRIAFLEDGKEYAMAQGYDRFIEKLAADFPGEEENIRNYCDKIREICARFPMYHLQSGGGLVEKSAVLDIDTRTYIESITSNPRLQEVLAGNNFLYAGEPYKTPFYVHALVLNSYIESSWKCVDGGSQITKWLAKRIRDNGGVIRNHAEVIRIAEENERISYVELKDGSRVRGKHFISNIHPQQTLAMTETTMLRAAYRNRINRLNNTISSFCVNAVMKPGAFPYYRHNYYIHDTDGVWGAIKCDKGKWPQSCCVFFSASSRSTAHTEALSILAYMPYEEVARWQDTFNTDSEPADRGADYEQFKKEKAEQLIAFVERKFPGLRGQIQSFTCTSPLSYRDYIGTADGSMYGIAKDFRDPMGTYLPSRTRVPNLYLTGQNLLLHGILGVTISALATCTELVDSNTLIEKIRNA
ncbi:phytoene desaturase family protein [Flavihumibacter stibioxidans]|uniref:All-trans-retinol 13,14-reductase n=1 Tax=Flavihumibacter stibioxidans TaxID=1834163 RepID=A0ABR7MAA7_9BACT|nr:NAD(P)/FAD-dependent oxidoreductase [Flavihumibacter stibioxidans]MBC6491902.1 all-trans-retinol 13,14-reductase [Flavihumibacter stibioxidans]